MDALKYKTLEKPACGDFRDRGSKFLSFVYPVLAVKDCKEALQRLRKEHPKANHHCYAYRLGHSHNNFRAVDDGEPAGSAGRPILNTLDSFGLSNVLAVVVRYFGGTLLGVPGLIHAYKTATELALYGTAIEERWIEAVYELQFDYPVMSSVMRLLQQAEATIVAQELQLFCKVTAGIPLAHRGVLAQLSELRSVVLTPVPEL